MPRIIDVIEVPDQAGHQIVRRVPKVGAGDFRLGAQLIVRENQRAVFFRDGQALDMFDPGRHTLTTANVPLLAGLIGLATQGRTPFPAEVYFVNMREFIDQKWGTPAPIALRDEELGMVRLRALGAYSMQVTEPQRFVAQIVGNQGLYQTSQIENYLRGIIVSKLSDLLGESQASLFDIPSLYDELSAAVRARLREDFDALGLALKALYIQSVTPTEETAQAIDERAAMGAIGDMRAYMQFKAARAMGAAAAAEGGEAGSLAGAGVGLGAGVGMGAAMAQMMSQAMQSGTQAPAATITCPECGANIPAGSRFCPQCGTKLNVPYRDDATNTCPECGAEVPAGAKFCPECGAEL
ncbi:MAG: SPFH domain-containing protein [Chloroflexota bacterium]|nr:SPFH domain-containing protein [Chloroflexota bacterium]